MIKEQILEKTKGKRLSEYNSWNSSSASITVESVEDLDGEYMFTGTSNCYGKELCIFVDADYIDALLENGKAERHDTIEYCDVVKRWNLN